MNGSESEIDVETGVSVLINDTAVPDDKIWDAITQQHPELAVLTRWGHEAQGPTRSQGVRGRDRYVTPQSIFSQFKVAADAAANDDVVSGVVETTEQLAFKRIAIECDDKAEEIVWNQVIDELDLSARMREIWRELFTLSQCYVASVWGRKTYTPKGKTEAGNQRKKQYKDLLVPLGLSLLDPIKVIPVGNFMFGQEKLVYIANQEEARQIDETLAAKNTSDLTVSQLLKGVYTPDRQELNQISEITGYSVATNKFYLLNPERVWRITSTRPAYQRFATVRMCSVFELLDLKHLLREMDRAHIIGGTNFIILAKKGDEKRPARPEELSQIGSQLRSGARVPIIVSDDRLEIEIITPKLDHTLQPERYNALDSRITARLYQILSTGNYASGTASDDSMKLLKVVAASMEARRDNIRDSIMTKMFKPMFERNDQLTEEPKMQYYPRRVALDFDPNIATYLQDLRDRGDISRETILAELDIIQSEEAAKREEEADKFDKIFGPVNVPFSSTTGVGGAPPATAPAGNNKSAGRTGGGKTGGGGTNRQSSKSGPPRGPSKSMRTIAREEGRGDLLSTILEPEPEESSLDDTDA